MEILLGCIFLVVTNQCYNVQAEPKGNIFTAIAHMEPLIAIEQRLVEIAREYLNKERRKLGELRSFAKSVEDAMKLSKDEPLKYLGNPVNSYLIIKRFTSGWRELSSRLDIDDSKIEDIKTILNSNEDHLPTRNVDLYGATVAIFRLQDTYQIPAREISDGKIKDISRSAHQLTAEDCHHISEYAHAAARYIYMEEWAKEAERIIDDPSLQYRVGNITRLEIYETVAWTSYLSNNLKEALKYTKLILEIEPKNEAALKNEEFYQFYEKENIERWLTGEQWDYAEAKKNLVNYRRSTLVRYCDPSKKIKPLNLKKKSSLVCFYKTNHPLYVLKPIRVTRYHDNPEVVVFHDALDDEEIKILENLATPYLRQAKVVEDDIKEADYRVAKTMFLMDVFPEVRKINKRLNRKFEAMTGLSTETAEELQMNNYGLGGQYEFHLDHGEKNDTFVANHRFGNRIATLLCYLSDVERGGETVFTRLGLSLKPKKGDAVFWYNLFLNGDGNSNTVHASCPVVSGSKWVANKWFHTLGNEFNRQCSLNKDE